MSILASQKYRVCSPQPVSGRREEVFVTDQGNACVENRQLTKGGACIFLYFLSRRKLELDVHQNNRVR